MGEGIVMQHGKMSFRDYPENRGTIVCFTGADVPDHRETLLRMQARACKLSYFGLTQRQYDLEALKDDLRRFDYVVVDPGMGSVRNMARKYGSDFHPSRFIAGYYRFCHQVKDVVNIFLAYDLVTEDFGWDDIETHVYMGYQDGLHIAPTVFPFVPRNILNNSGYLETFDIVSMPFPEKHWTYASELADYINSTGVKIHGHSVSSPAKYRHLPLYSADTSAWLDGQKYGTTFRYAGGTLSTYNVRDKESARLGLYSQARENGIDIDLLEKDRIRAKNDYLNTDPAVIQEVNALNLMSWMQFAELQRGGLHA